MTLPFVGLLAGHHDPAPLTPLVVALRSWCRPHACDPALGAPDAFLAADPHAIGLAAALAGPTPVAVLIDSHGPISDTVRDHTDVFIVRDHEAATRFGDRAIVFPRDHVRASDHPSLTPFVRSRWRQRLGLPATLVVRLGVPDPFPTDPFFNDDATVPAALAVSSVAIVRGPWTLTALALGTPVITDAGTAQRIGATHNVSVVVASPTEGPGRAEALAADPARATALGWGGRLLVEERHDLATVAIALLDGLGIGPAPFPLAQLASLDAELAALGTPDTSPVALRAFRRAAAITDPADWTELTGRRR